MVKQTRPRSPATLAIASLLLCAAACNLRDSGERIPPDVVARAGDRMVTLADYKRYLQRNAGVDLSQIAPAAASALLDQYLEELLLAEHAERSGLDIAADQVAEAVRNDPGATVEEKTDQLRRERLLNDISASLPDPSEGEIRSYFDRNRDEFRVDERVRARQILVHDEQKAREALARLKDGVAFEEVSREFSTAPNAQRGGDIGYVGRGQLPRIFEDAIFDLAPGQVSRIIETDSSYHIFKVEERKPAGSISIETAEPLIRSRLRSDALDTEVTGIVDRMQKNVTVRIYTKRLPFEYDGAFTASGDE